VLLAVLLTLPIPLLCWYAGYRAASRVVPGVLSPLQHSVGLLAIVASFYALFALAAFAPAPGDAPEGSRASLDWFRIMTYILPIIGIAFGARGLAQFLLLRAGASR
jgi:hypothetical protein